MVRLAHNGIKYQPATAGRYAVRTTQHPHPLPPPDLGPEGGDNPNKMTELDLQMHPEIVN